MVSYERLWKTMEKKGISQYRLINHYKISAGQIGRMKKNMHVSTHTLEVFCNILQCPVEDIVEVILDPQEPDGKEPSSAGGRAVGRTAAGARDAKKAEGVTSAEVYEELTGMGVRIQSLSDATSQVTEMKNDPMTQGINGFFTLSFLVTMALTFVGFFLYWILAIRGRLLQFGILRSMGLSRLSVIFVLLWEQILVSVTAILAGLGLGTLAAELYAPILECNVDAASQVLPFQVAAASADYWRIIGVVAAMMAVAALVLGRTVYRLRAGEALKLGED